MASVEKFNLVILGSGSTAFAAALRAQELGKTAVMTEERSVGGTCVNRGCLPSKNLIEAARLVHDAAHPRYPGLRSAKLDVDFPSLVEQKDEVIAGYRQKKYESLLGGEIHLERGHAELVDANTVDVGGKRLTGDAILIATGSRPVLPDIRGLSDVPYLTSDLLTSGEAGELKELPRSLLIVGGGYIALELGQMFHRLGSAVTILERGAELFGHGYEPEVGPAVRKLLVEEGVEVLTSAAVSAVRADGGQVIASVVVGGKPREIRVERLLVAAGRRPNTDRIGLEKAGVALGELGQVVVDEHLRTGVPHIFAAGDVVGREWGSQMATPVGSQDGGIAAHNAMSGEPPRKVSHRVIPRAVFIDPPLAVVGMTEEEAVGVGYPCWCRAVPMSLVPRTGAIRDTRGFVKMVADRKTDEVLGVTMLGQGAAEVIHEAAMALRFRAKLQDFIDLLHVYPTMSEALKVAAISRFADPAKLSCCADVAVQRPREALPLHRVGKGAMRHLDKLGVLGSIFGALCCLGVSALVSVVSAIGLGFLISDAVLLPLLLVFLGVTVAGLGIGYRRHHRSLALVLGLLAGLGLFVFSFVSQSRPLAYLSIAGLVAASILNTVLHGPRLRHAAHAG